MIANAREAARGRWPDICARLAIDVGHGEHRPCPACGGRDRFRFDDRDGRGTYFCNGCEPKSGDGFRLIQNVRRCSFKEAKALVSEVLGTGVNEPPRQNRKRASSSSRETVRAIWAAAQPGDACISTYLRSRGLSGTVPPNLRFHPSVEYWELAAGAQDHGGPVCRGSYPAMVGEIVDGNDRGLGVHMTYLDPNGHGKADVSSPKKVKKYRAGDGIAGGAIRLFPLTPAIPLVVAEGIETAVAIHEATGWAAWACMSAGGLESVLLPPQADTIYIGVDLDLSGRGQKAGEALVQRLHKEGRRVFLVVPEGPIPREAKGRDWCDVRRSDGVHAVQAAFLNAKPWLAPVAHATPIGDGGSGLVRELADGILRSEYFAQDSGGLLYHFRAGVYRPDGEAVVLALVKKTLVDQQATRYWSTHRAREVAAYIQVDAPKLWERPPLETINLANGLLRLDTKALLPHSNSHLSSIQLPVRYDLAAKCPKWDQFIAQVFPADCVSLAYELVAYLMRPDVSQQTAFLFIGDGGNGKSTFLMALIAFLGRLNVVNVSLHRLETDRFAMARLIGKLTNICPDLPADHLTSTSIFKAVVGSDVVSAERKFQSSFEFLPFTRLVFSANHYPQSKDGSHAFFRRWQVIPFERTFSPAERKARPEMDAMLADPDELSGVLNEAIAVLPGLERRGTFIDSPSTAAALLEFREQTDPIAAWLDANTSRESDAVVTKKDLCIAYNSYADANGRPFITKKALGMAVKRLRPDVQERQRIICGELKEVWLGLRLGIPGSSSRSGDSGDSGHFPYFSNIKKNERNRRNDLNRLNEVNGMCAVPDENEEVYDDET